MNLGWILFLQLLDMVLKGFVETLVFTHYDNASLCSYLRGFLFYMAFLKFLWD